MINISNNLIQAMYHGANFKRVISSALTIFIAAPLQLGIFYRLLLALAYDKSYLSLFKILQCIAMGFYGLCSIMGMGAINGFYRAHVCFSEKQGMGVPGVLCIVEGFIYWLLILMSLAVLFKAGKNCDEEAKEDPEDLNTQH